MESVAREAGALDDAAIAHLQAVVAEWQLLADLAFADLLLWLPLRSSAGDWPTGHSVIAQIRPTTAATVHLDDLIGYEVAWGQRSTLDRALSDEEIQRDSDARWKNGLHIVEEVIPVKFKGATIATISRHINAAATRTPSKLELTYLQSANDLIAMIASGHFPTESMMVSEASPRVGDGLIRLDESGRVTYISPNASSALRRLGVTDVLDGAILGQVINGALERANRDPADESWSALLSGRIAREFDIETSQCVVDFRVIPLVPAGHRVGAIVLLRDVTDIQRRERELVTKNATIREIHHRVKNNLQTVAALLRLQSRRVEDPTARQALTEAVQRVAAIALVHETLSSSDSEEYVEFDAIVDGTIALLSEVIETKIAIERHGSFGAVNAKQATTLSMIITELIQNAGEHARGASKVKVTVDRQGEALKFSVCDDGTGFPAGFVLAESKSLGLSIVSTLVTNELGGTLTLGSSSALESSNAGTGACVEIELRLA